jgi:hypothetical protein
MHQRPYLRNPRDRPQRGHQTHHANHSKNHAPQEREIATDLRGHAHDSGQQKRQIHVIGHASGMNILRPFDVPELHHAPPQSHQQKTTGGHRGIKLFHKSSLLEWFLNPSLLEVHFHFVSVTHG